ncbi:MAG TPA: ArsA-related P-loop ATPase [Candidatus Kryptonia bacterium]|nr:ArsA-related P-loop ATPase [Candidatus Kryptonia bacterium]
MSQPSSPRARTTNTHHDLLRKRLIVCVGTGGVGKTTVAAALGVAAAIHQRRAAVITFDPARRLKDALGLTRLTTDPHPVPLGPDGDGLETLDAMALDTKHVFDAVVRRFAPTPEVAERILGNRLYQQLSSELGGSAEYMAMEKLHELLHHTHYRLVVVDTPPSSHARDLLAAPTRLGELLASRAVAFLKSPAALLAGSGGFARFTLGTLLKALERWSGLSLLQDLAGFVEGFESMITGFQSRAEEVGKLLRASSTAFVLVTTPEPDAVATAIAFHRELRVAGFHVAGVVANRVLAFPRRADLATDAATWPPALQRKLLANYADLQTLSRRDRHTLTHLHETTGMPLLAAVPMLSAPPQSLTALRRFATYLE